MADIAQMEICTMCYAKRQGGRVSKNQARLSNLPAETKVCPWGRVLTEHIGNKVLFQKESTEVVREART